MTASCPVNHGLASSLKHSRVPLPGATTSIAPAAQLPPHNTNSPASRCPTTLDDSQQNTTHAAEPSTSEPALRRLLPSLICLILCRRWERLDCVLIQRLGQVGYQHHHCHHTSDEANLSRQQQQGQARQQCEVWCTALQAKLDCGPHSRCAADTQLLRCCVHRCQ